MATTKVNESTVKDNYRIDFKAQAYSKYGNRFPKENHSNGFKHKALINENKSSNSYSYSKENYRNTYKDKDDETDYKAQRFQKSVPKGKGPQKPEQEQVDKLETIKRLEREKKALMKKNREEEFEKQKRRITKEKRTSGINWTKEYEYGLLDE